MYNAVVPIHSTFFILMLWQLIVQYVSAHHKFTQLIGYVSSWPGPAWLPLNLCSKHVVYMFVIDIYRSQTVFVSYVHVRCMGVCELHYTFPCVRVKADALRNIPYLIGERMYHNIG